METPANVLGDWIGQRRQLCDLGQLLGLRWLVGRRVVVLNALQFPQHVLLLLRWKTMMIFSML